MTTNQRNALMIEWWPAAARAQGWSSNDRTLRLHVLNLALNCKFGHVLEVQEALENYELLSRLPSPVTRRPFRQIASASDLDNRGDIDAVKALLGLLAGNLEAAAEQGRPQDGQGRRLNLVLDELLQCLALYPLNDPMGRNRAYDYALKIARSRVPDLYQLSDLDDNLGHRRDQATGLTRISPSDREQILYTINARLNGKTGFRHKAGHSMHEMYKAAGLPCNCRTCIKRADDGAQPAEPLQVPSLTPPAPAVKAVPNPF